ncbi:MAG: phosphoribosylanthranilate isomerase [Lachnospiraceae bacterium]
MTKIKLCGISRMCEIDIINELKPEYIGFVFAANSKRYVSPDKAARLKKNLQKDIQTVGVFVNESVEQVAKLLNEDIIQIAQLHGDEDEAYISRLRQLSNRPIIKAFRIKDESDITNVEKSSADYVLLDSGAGGGYTFDWDVVKSVRRPFFLAGGLDEKNVRKAIKDIHPFAVDVSSGIETNGLKDKVKMEAFVAAVRKEEI